MADFNIMTQIENLGRNTVEGYEFFVKSFVEANMPEVDVSKGSVFYDLIIRNNAVLQALNYANINRFRRGASLLEIAKAPELTDPAMVDALLSNFRITRKAGSKAAGTVTIYLSNNNTTSIPSGSVFVSGTLSFVTTQTYIGVPTQNLVTKTTDRLITGPDNGLYSFTIEVEAAADGAEYQLSQGTQLSLQTPPSNYVRTKATYDFMAGASTETNRELLKRLEYGISGKTCASRKNIRALIEDTYPDVLHGAVIGFGDSDMQRDKINIFNTSFGGKSDIYVQTATRPITTVLELEATLVNASAQLWQIHINRDDFAGMYQIVSVLPQNSDLEGTFAITSDTRSVNTAPLSSASDAFIPEIANYTQAAFSRYQEATIEFVDTVTDTSGMTNFETKQTYDVTVLGLPDIAGIQDNVISDYWASSHRYDDLVRAPIPVLTNITAGVRIPLGTAIDINASKQAIADRINNLGFTDSLSTSIVADVLHGMIDVEGMVVMPIDLYGELIDPEDGQPVGYRSGNVLKIPTDHTKSISAKTLMFFVDPTDIDIYTETF